MPPIGPGWSPLAAPYPAAKKSATPFVVVAVILGLLGFCLVALFLVTLAAPVPADGTRSMEVAGGLLIYMTPGVLFLIGSAIFIGLAVRRAGK